MMVYTDSGTATPYSIGLFKYGNVQVVFPGFYRARQTGNTATNDKEFLHSLTGDGAYAFDPVRGLFRDLDDSLTMEMHSNSRDYKLNLIVNNTGRVILCSDDSSHSVPGYDVCPAPMVEVAEVTE